MALVVKECHYKGNSWCDGSYLIAERTCTTEWQLETDGADREISAYDIMLWGENGETPTVSGDPLPRYGSLYGSTGMVLKKKTPTQIVNEDAAHWRVILEYGYVTAGGLDLGGASGRPEDNGALDPLQWLPRVRRFTTEIQEPVESTGGKGGNPKVAGAVGTLVMSNGRPFDNVPVRSRHLPSVRITQYESGYSGTAASAIVGSVNSVQFLGLASRTVLCTAMDGELDFWQNGQSVIPVYQVSYQFIHNKREWTPGRYLSQDVYEKFDGHLRPIVVNGAPRQDPWPLDIAGKAIPEENLLDGSAKNLEGQPGGFYYIEVNLHDEFDFNLLPLPYQFL